MNRIELHEAINTSLQHILPELFKKAISFQRKIDSMPDMLTRTDAANALNISLSSLDKIIKSGEITLVYLPDISYPRIQKSEIEELMTTKECRTL